MIYIKIDPIEIISMKFMKCFDFEYVTRKLSTTSIQSNFNKSNSITRSFYNSNQIEDNVKSENYVQFLLDTSNFYCSNISIFSTEYLVEL